MQQSLPLVIIDLADAYPFSHQHSFPAACCRRVSFRRRADPKAVAVRVAQLNLTRPRSILRLHTELESDGLDITNAEVDQRVGAGVALVLRQEQPYPAPGDLDERRKSRFEAVFPLLRETQSLIPRDRCRSVLDVKNGNDFLHGAIVADRAASGLGQTTRAQLRGTMPPRLPAAGTM